VTRPTETGTGVSVTLLYCNIKTEKYLFNSLNCQSNCIYKKAKQKTKTFTCLGLVDN